MEIEELFSQLGKALQEFRMSVEKGEISPQEAACVLKRAMAILELPVQKKVNPSEISVVLDLAEKEREILADLLMELGGRLAETFREQCEGAEFRKKVLEELRRVNLWFQPPDDFIRMGLAEGFKYFAKKSLEGFPVEIEFHPEGFPEKLPRLLSLFLFRILQGALLYAYRYARATRVELSSSAEKGVLSFQLRHNGSPFDERDAGMLTALIPLYARVRALGGEMEVAENGLIFRIPFISG